MRPTDRQILSQKPISHDATLVRVINHGGVPFSCIEVNGAEVMSAPTSDEAGLLRYWEKSYRIFTFEKHLSRKKI